MIAKLAFNPFFGAYKRSSHFQCLGWNSPLHKQFVTICSMDFLHSILHLWTWLTSLACPTSNSFGKKLIENFANISHMFYSHYRFKWSPSHPHWHLINIDLRHSQSKKCKLVFANESRSHAKHWKFKNLGSTFHQIWQ